MVKQASGFEYQPERPGAPDFVAQKWGWRGTAPGDWAELELDTRAPAGSGPPDRDVVVWLAYLKSYQVCLDPA